MASALGVHADMISGRFRALYDIASEAFLERKKDTRCLHLLAVRRKA